MTRCDRLHFPCDAALSIIITLLGSLSLGGCSDNGNGEQTAGRRSHEAASELTRSTVANAVDPKGDDSESETGPEPAGRPESTALPESTEGPEENETEDEAESSEPEQTESSASVRETPAPIPENRLLQAPEAVERETEQILEQYVGPDQRVRDSMLPPKGARPLGRDNHLWIDRDAAQVIADGYVTMTRGVLEMFACPMGSKEHESVVATLAQAKEVHAALLAVGGEPGTPVQFIPKFVPATGQLIRVWVCWRDAEGKYRVVDARNWVQKVDSEASMQADWVFAGSGFWKDPSDGRDYYQADGGDMICVSNFSTAMMDISIASSAESDQLLFQPATDAIPERGTPVRLVLVPIPNPVDTKDADEKRRLQEQIDAKKNVPPKEDVLPPLRDVKSDSSDVR